jgi:hypothetical protein
MTRKADVGPLVWHEVFMPDRPRSRLKIRPHRCIVCGARAAAVERVVVDGGWRVRWEWCRRCLPLRGELTTGVLGRA